MIINLQLKEHLVRLIFNNEMQSKLKKICISISKTAIFRAVSWIEVSDGKIHSMKQQIILSGVEFAQFVMNGGTAAQCLHKSNLRQHFERSDYYIVFPTLKQQWLILKKNYHPIPMTGTIYRSFQKWFYSVGRL